MPFPHVAGASGARVDEAECSWSAAVGGAVHRIRQSGGGSVLDRLVTAATGLLEAPAVAALLEDGVLVSRAQSGVDRSLLGSDVTTVGRPCERVLGTGRPVRRDDVLVGSAAAPGASCCRPGTRSVLAAPLRSADRVLGVVCVLSDRPGTFTGADEQALHALAAAGAKALAEDTGEAAPTGRVPVQPGRVRTRAEGVSGVAEATAETVEPDVARPAGTCLVPGAGPGLRAVGLWQWDALSGRVSCSPQVTAALGLSLDAVICLDVIRGLLHPDDLGRFDENLLHQVGRRVPVEGEFRVVTPSGALRHLHAWSDVRVVDDRIVGAFGGVADVTARKAVTAALREQGTALRGVRELTGVAFWEWDPATGGLTWSPEMCLLTGQAAGVQPTLACWHHRIHPDDLPRARRLDVEAFDRRDGHAETLRVVGADGVWRHLRVWSVVVTLDGGARVVQGAAVDVTGPVNDRLRLERLSATDPVTGLGNRIAFERRVTEMLADRSRDVTLLLLDLDRFKIINDSLGHQMGDRLLVEVARRLAGVVPGGSLTARMGGDEFVVVPRPGVGWLQVRRLAETIVETLRRPYLLPETGEMLVCPVSVGVTSTSGREVSAEALLSEADLALYQAKDSGRDRYVVFDDALRSRARGKHLAEQLLRTALERDWLTLRYQPIADLRTGRVVGAEALVRITDAAGGGLVLPDAFIEVAEDTGLVVELDCWVVDTALSQLRRWSDARRGRNLPWLAVNLSARSMEHPRVVERLLEGLCRQALPARAVKVELTEHSFLGALPGGESTLRALLDSGVPVGIDDFGTGYSALAYLQRFDLDFMKIDRSFVASVGRTDRADAVATAIVGLAHAHGMQVTAEGIENSLQARRLSEIGCDYAQGYHVGRPVEASLLLD